MKAEFSEEFVIRLQKERAAAISAKLDAIVQRDEARYQIARAIAQLDAFLFLDDWGSRSSAIESIYEQLVAYQESIR